MSNSETMLAVGDKLPSDLGFDSEGKMVHSEDFAGKPLIVYFYPKDNTSGCTAEACSIRDDYARLTGMGYVVIGISKYSLPFLLLSDESTEVNQAFGVWQKKKMAGREYMGTVRTTFVTDADHRITHVVKKVDTKRAGTQLIELLS